MRLYAVIIDGKIVETLDTDDSCSEYSSLCGGCGDCMYQQALYTSYQVVLIEPEIYETLGDSCGRIEKDLEDSDDRRETEKISHCESSEEPVKGDEARSEQQGD